MAVPIRNISNNISIRLPPPSQMSKTYKSQPTKGSKSHDIFWDTLAQIHLTKGALRELDRRNAEYLSHREHRTGSSIAKRDNPTGADFLHYCNSQQLKELRRFARRGGPDLSSLKGVSYTLELHHLYY